MFLAIWCLTSAQRWSYKNVYLCKLWRTPLGVYKTLPGNSCSQGTLKFSPLHFTKIGALTPLNAILNIIKYQNCGNAPNQKMSFRETNKKDISTVYLLGVLLGQGYVMIAILSF